MCKIKCAVHLLWSKREADEDAVNGRCECSVADAVCTSEHQKRSKLIEVVSCTCNPGLTLHVTFPFPVIVVAAYGLERAQKGNCIILSGRNECDEASACCAIRFFVFCSIEVRSCVEVLT